MAKYAKSKQMAMDVGDNAINLEIDRGHSDKESERLGNIAAYLEERAARDHRKGFRNLHDKAARKK